MMTRYLFSLFFLAGLSPIPAWAEQPVPQESPRAAFAKSERYVDRMKREGAIMELNMEEALHRALTNNLEIIIEGYNQDLARERIRQTRGFYDPVLFFSGGFDSLNTPLISSFTDGRIPSRTIETSDFGLTLLKNLTHGGSFNVSLTNDRTYSDASPSFNPLLESRFSLRFTQPLLRGFTQTSTEWLLKIRRLDSRISYSQFREKVLNIVQRVQKQYWELVFAIENYEVRRRSRDLAVVQFSNTRSRVESELLAPVALTSSRAEVANREQGMIQSEVQIIVAQNELKRLLSPDAEDPLWGIFLIPVDRPQPKEVNISLDEAARQARRRRPELKQFRLLLEQNEIDRKFFANEKKPSLDLIGSLSSVGRSGMPSDLLFPLGGHPAAGSFGTALTQAFSFEFPSWGIGLSLHIPLHNRTADASLAQAKILKRKYINQMKNLEQAIIVEVRNSFQVVETRKKSLDSARLARVLSEELLAGETARFEVGFSTNFEVLRYQRDVEAARVRELRALVDFQLAIVSLQRATDVLLEENGIVLPAPR